MCHTCSVRAYLSSGHLCLLGCYFGSGFESEEDFCNWASKQLLNGFWEISEMVLIFSFILLHGSQKNKNKKNLSLTGGFDLKEGFISTIKSNKETFIVGIHIPYEHVFEF